MSIFHNFEYRNGEFPKIAFRPRPLWQCQLSRKIVWHVPSRYLRFLSRYLFLSCFYRRLCKTQNVNFSQFWIPKWGISQNSVLTTPTMTMAIVQKDSLACLLALFEDFKSKNISVVFLLTFFEYRKMNTEYRIPNSSECTFNFQTFFTFSKNHLTSLTKWYPKAALNLKTRK